MKTTAHTRKHAALIRITARNRNDEYLLLALAYADRLEAEADLADAQAGIEPKIADNADIEQIVPVFGRIVYSGGIIKSAQHEWNKAHQKEAYRQGLMLTWEWCSSLHVPDAGMCMRFYAGTRESGPLVLWTSYDGYWRKCKSNGNYGGNWACGGNWQHERVNTDEAPDRAIRYQNYYIYKTLEECNPVIHQLIENVIETINPKDKIRIAKAKAKLEAAILRERAATHRQRAIAYRKEPTRRNSSLTAERDNVNARTQDALADKFEARAKLAESNF